MTTWIALIKQYWQVSLFKESPANTPCSWFLLVLMALFFYFLLLLQWSMTETDASVMQGRWVAALILLITYALYTYVLLSVSRLTSRFIQTLTCLFAAHSIVHLLAFPLIEVTPWLLALKNEEPLALLAVTMYFLLTLILTIWQFMIMVHIYKAALSVNYVSAVLASIGLLASSILMVSLWR